MKLAVIIGTTREGRKTVNQAKWVLKAAQAAEGVEAELVDLKDYPLPFFNEPVSPRYNPSRQLTPDIQKWLAKLEEFEAYIFVTAEYNHSVPGVLKNALDYVTWELQRKPGAVVSHGSAGGARAQTDLKEILSESRVIIMPALPQLSITGMSDLIDEDGNLSETKKTDPYGPQPALEALIRELKWAAGALTPARAKVKIGLETA